MTCKKTKSIFTSAIPECLHWNIHSMNQDIAKIKLHCQSMHFVEMIQNIRARMINNKQTYKISAINGWWRYCIKSDAKLFRRLDYARNPSITHMAYGYLRGNFPTSSTPFTTTFLRQHFSLDNHAKRSHGRFQIWIWTIKSNVKGKVR